MISTSSTTFCRGSNESNLFSGIIETFCLFEIYQNGLLRFGKITLVSCIQYRKEVVIVRHEISLEELKRISKSKLRTGRTMGFLG